MGLPPSFCSGCFPSYPDQWSWSSSSKKWRGSSCCCIHKWKTRCKDKLVLWSLSKNIWLIFPTEGLEVIKREVILKVPSKMASYWCLKLLKISQRGFLVILGSCKIFLQRNPQKKITTRNGPARASLGTTPPLKPPYCAWPYGDLLGNWETLELGVWLVLIYIYIYLMFFFQWSYFVSIKYTNLPIYSLNHFQRSLPNMLKPNFFARIFW